ncbi:hypothetical protein Lal_00015247 [Lupinus albus]|nr:hypothetical protein Lal_00015247 [Lupinus albus]
MEERIDRKWMSVNRLTKEYEDGVKSSVRFAYENAENSYRIVYPCLICCYSNQITLVELRVHLVYHDIDQSYTCWTGHGEKILEIHMKENNSNAYEGDRFDEMVNVVEEDLQDRPQMFQRLISDAGKPLYGGCTKFTIFAVVSMLYKLKSVNGWTDKSFTDLLTLLKDILPEDNVIPSRTYEDKQMICSIGMDYNRIHAYENDCILFLNEYALLKHILLFLTSHILHILLFSNAQSTQ